MPREEITNMTHMFAAPDKTKAYYYNCIYEHSMNLVVLEQLLLWSRKTWMKGNALELSKQCKGQLGVREKDNTVLDSHIIGTAP